MKKTHLLITLSLATFLLGGCVDVDTSQQDPTPEETNEQVVNEQPANVSPDAEDITTPPPTPNLSVEDLQFYEGALQLRDESYCDNISDQEAAEQCKKEIMVQKTIEEALQTGDESVCDSLDDVGSELCRMQMEQTMQKVDDFRDLTAQEMAIMQQAVDENNAAVCDQIESERKRENCRTNVQTSEEISQYYEQ